MQIIMTWDSLSSIDDCTGISFIGSEILVFIAGFMFHRRWHAPCKQSLFMRYIALYLKKAIREAPPLTGWVVCDIQMNDQLNLGGLSKNLSI